MEWRVWCDYIQSELPLSYQSKDEKEVIQEVVYYSYSQTIIMNKHIEWKINEMELCDEDTNDSNVLWRLGSYSVKETTKREIWGCSIASLPTRDCWLTSIHTLPKWLKDQFQLIDWTKTNKDWRDEVYEVILHQTLQFNSTSWKRIATTWKNHLQYVQNHIITTNQKQVERLLSVYKNQIHYGKVANQLEDRSKSPLYRARLFQNWMKAELLYRFAFPIIQRKQQSTVVYVLDIACGRGGDLQKWIKWWERTGDHRKLCVVAIDHSHDAIQEAMKRATKISTHNVTFCFRTESAFPLSGQFTKEFQNKFVFAQCHFAIHYAMETKELFSQTMKSIACVLTEEAHFVCTFPSPKRFSELASTDSIISNPFLQEVKRQGHVNINLVGTRHIVVSLEGCLQNCPEPLVELDWFYDCIDLTPIDEICTFWNASRRWISSSSLYPILCRDIPCDIFQDNWIPLWLEEEQWMAEAYMYLVFSKPNKREYE